MDNDKQTFWDHLDVLRAELLKIAAVTILCGIVAFMFKAELFAIVFAPKESDFVTYRLLFGIGGFFTDDADRNFSVRLINTGLAGQFMIHMKMAMCTGMLCASPYIIYRLFCFVSPALYSNERKYALRLTLGGYFMFAVGVLMSYFLIFPLTFRFLGTYQVSGDVVNMINLQSYISALITMSLSMGVVFEIPVLSWVLARLGLISATFMRQYRRHAIVLMLVVAAVITPTADVFTMSLVALPMWLLYEASVFIVVRTVKESPSDNHSSC